jgi:hypothetical protein
MATKKTTENARPEQIDAALEMGAQTVEKVIQAGEQVMRASKDALDSLDTKETAKIARDQVETTSKTFFAGQDQVTAFNLAAFDAYASAFEAFSQGNDKFNAEVADFTRKSIEATVKNAETLMACKSVNEAFDLRDQIARATIDSTIAQATKLTEMSLKTAKDGWAPIQDHAGQSLDNLKPRSA